MHQYLTTSTRLSRAFYIYICIYMNEGIFLNQGLLEALGKWTQIQMPQSRPGS